MEEPNAKRKEVFRAAIYKFIDDRLETKLDKNRDEDGAGVSEKLDQKIDYDSWLADAARRVRHIQMVTHPLKATFPDAKVNETTNLYLPKVCLSERLEVSSHSAPDGIRDVSGNAASLDVYTLLQVKVLGAEIIDWLQNDDIDLISALNDEPQIADEWARAFKELIRPVQIWASHQMAKQLFWCTTSEPSDNASYHLLQPMFSSTLAHAVHDAINDAQFGEVNTEALHAWRDRKPHDGVFREYKGLIAQKLGGTKPRNISQLNNKRGGVNYLLASLPPSWGKKAPKTLLKMKSAFPFFAHYEGVEELVSALSELLTSDPPSAMGTRIQREFIERALGQQLAAFRDSIRARFKPGWTRDERCKLPLCEQIWLDPDRVELSIREPHAEEDQSFIDEQGLGDWADQIAHRFANWINEILHERGLPVGDAEHAHWARQAIVDVAWPMPMQRRAITRARTAEKPHD